MQLLCTHFGAILLRSPGCAPKILSLPIFCSVWGLMRFDPEIQQWIDTVPFQRLRDLQQLGLSSYVSTRVASTHDFCMQHCA